MFNQGQFREYVVRPTLHKLKMWSQAAEDLLVGTAAAESRLGTYLHQVRGPAKGVYQMEPATHADIWTNWLRYHPGTAEVIRSLVAPADWDQPEYRPGHWALVTNLTYATAMARLHYRRVKETLPATGDWHALAVYWKKHYNTEQGKGTIEHFMAQCSVCGTMA